MSKFLMPENLSNLSAHKIGDYEAYDLRKRTRRILFFLLIVGINLLLLGVQMSLDWFQHYHFSILFGGILIFVSLFFLGLSLIFRPSKRKFDNQVVEWISDHLESGIEMLKDAHWELSEDEARYRDLLDNQYNVIMRRGADGRLTFVNDAFCRTFNKKKSDILNQNFHLVVLDGDLPETFDQKTIKQRRSYTQSIETAHGPRWFAWEDFAILNEDRSITEMQTVGRDITKHYESEAILQEAREQAEAASRSKSRFLAAMSHEIRTPMNGIQGMSNLLFDTDLTPEQLTYTRAIDKSAKTLLALIDEILDFSKIEAGKMEIDNQPLELSELVQGVSELLSPRAYEKGIEIGWYLDPWLPARVFGDEIRLRQILMNLIGNAIKFTDQGGVAIEVTCAPDFTGSDKPQKSGEKKRIPICFSIRDSGLGMTEEAQKKVFREFEQGDSGPARRYGGTGLGLAISKRLAEKMGGRISVKSELGRGSTFTVDLLFEVGRQNAPEQKSFEPKAGQRILIASRLTTEAELIAKILHASKSDVILTSLDEAAAVIRKASEQQKYFNVFISDGSGHKETQSLMQQMVNSSGGNPVRGIILLNASERDEISFLEARGFSSYLARPVRPRSLFTQLQGKQDLTLEALGKKTSSQTTSLFKKIWPSDFTPRVLLVEDNEINALLSCKMLEKYGCHVSQAWNGQEAIEAIEGSLQQEDQGFDLIFMDVHMPEMDGFVATSKIKSRLAACPQSQISRLPIIALTADAVSEGREVCLKAGMDDYLTKPFSIEELEDVLEKWISSPRPALPEKKSALH